MKAFIYENNLRISENEFCIRSRLLRFAHRLGLKTKFGNIWREGRRGVEREGKGGGGFASRSLGFFF